MKSIIITACLLSGIFSGYGQKIIIKKDTIRVYKKDFICKCLPGSYNLEKDSKGKIRKVYIETDLRTFYIIDTIKN